MCKPWPGSANKNACICLCTGASQQADASTGVGDTQGGAAAPPQDEASSSSIPPLTASQRNSRSQRSSKAPSRDPSFKTVSDTEQSSSDAELETSVVDTLTDAVLTACSHAPQDVKRRLIAVLDQAIVRPAACHIPDSAAGVSCLQPILTCYGVLFPTTRLFTRKQCTCKCHVPNVIRQMCCG